MESFVDKCKQIYACVNTLTYSNTHTKTHQHTLTHFLFSSVHLHLKHTNLKTSFPAESLISTLLLHFTEFTHNLLFNHVSVTKLKSGEKHTHE